jgi:hypothetical protein
MAEPIFVKHAINALVNLDCDKFFELQTKRVHLHKAVLRQLVQIPNPDAYEALHALITIDADLARSVLAEYKGQPNETTQSLQQYLGLPVTELPPKPVRPPVVRPVRSVRTVEAPATEFVVVDQP